jgi:uncharacterized Zn finger protein (UPF0148 family)
MLYGYDDRAFSIRCARAVSRRRRAVERAERRDGGAVCANCGAAYTATRIDSRTCSTRCRVALHRKESFDREVWAEFDRMRADPGYAGLDGLVGGMAIQKRATDIVTERRRAARRKSEAES